MPTLQLQAAGSAALVTDGLQPSRDPCLTGRFLPSQRLCSKRHLRLTVQASALTLRAPKLPGVGRSTQQAQKDVLESIKSVEGRGKKGMSEEQLAQFEEAVAILTKAGGVRAPTRSGLLDGKWRLLFTTRPGSASPIQRAFVGVNAFSVYQEITLQDGADARVNNIVDFGPKIGQLKVEAEASTDARPREGFTPRKGAGLPLFGKSENYPAEKKDMRIDFQFDQAAFDIKFLPFKIPYPVPFKLLGDETKGWLDITYLSDDGSFRISQGNKGTVFVLQREQSPKEALLAAVAAKAPSEEIKGLIQKLQASADGVARPAQSSTYTGSWELLWDFSPKEAPALQRAVLGVSRAYQLATLEGGQGKVTNVAQFPLGLSINTLAQCTPDAPDRSEIAFDEFYIKAGPLRYTLPFKPEGVGYWTWLYLDNDLRVMEGSKGSMFIHQRIPDGTVKP